MSTKQAFATDHEGVLRHLPEAVLLVDMANDFPVLYTNISAQECFGTTQLAGQSLSSLLGQNHALCEKISECVKTGQSIRLSQIDWKMPNGERKDVAISLHPVNGQIIVSLHFHGVEVQLDQQRHHKRTIKPVETMSVQLAHEIKNPLSGIKGAAQLLEQVVTEKDDKELARLIQSETQRIRRLLDKMEAFSTTAALPEKEPVNLHDVLQQVLTAAQAGFARHAKIVEDYDPSLPDIKGHRDSLFQVLMNLLKNAAEATQDTKQPVIKVRSYFNTRPVYHADHAAKLCVAIAVEDNGCGIDANSLPLLFNPFFTTKPDGTGLGLAMAARIIDEHGGILTAESNDGKTVFTLFLPRGDKT